MSDSGNSDSEGCDSALDDNEEQFPVQEEPNIQYAGQHLNPIAQYGAAQPVAERNDYNNELEAKNTVIETLTSKVQSLERQIKVMSCKSSQNSLSINNSDIERSKASALPSQNGFRESSLFDEDDDASCSQSTSSIKRKSCERSLSAEDGHKKSFRSDQCITYNPNSNSTDSEKLAGSTDISVIIDLQSQIQDLTQRNEKLYETNRAIDNELKRVNKMWQEALGLKLNFETKYHELLSKVQKEKEMNDVLRNQIDVQSSQLKVVEEKNKKYQSNEKHFKSIIQDREEQCEKLKREMNKLIHAKQSSSLDNLVMTQEGSTAESEEGQRLIQMVHQLMVELKQTSEIVQQQSVVIRRLQAKRARTATQGQSTEADMMEGGARPKVRSSSSSASVANVRHPVPCDEDVTKSMMGFEGNARIGQHCGDPRSRSPLVPTEHTDSPFSSCHLTAAADTSFSGRSYRARSTDWVDGAAGTSRDSATGMSASSSAPPPRSSVNRNSAAAYTAPVHPHGNRDNTLMTRSVATFPLSSSLRPAAKGHSHDSQMHRSSAFNLQGPIDLDSMDDLPPLNNNSRGRPEGSSQVESPMNVERVPNPTSPPHTPTRRYDDNTRSQNIASPQSRLKSPSPLATSALGKPVTSGTASRTVVSDILRDEPVTLVEQQRTPLGPPRLSQSPEQPGPSNRVATEQSDGDSDEDVMICPMCSEQQPRGTSLDDFQTHVLGCLGSNDPAPPMIEDDGEDKVCPICNQLFPFTVPQTEFEAHVNDHFDNDFTVLPGSDRFGGASN